MRTAEQAAAGGHTTARYARVRDALTQVGAQHSGGMNVAVYEHGREVANVWCGHGQDGQRRFTDESLVMTASCTKAVTALCALVLADRGELDLDAPVAEYWPEFAANGKKHIPVRWLLSHRTGLPLFDPGVRMTAEGLTDWDKVVTSLARQAPLWEPGRYCGYHAVTFGFLAGELVRRVSGRTVGQFLSEELAGPVGAEFWIGLPESLEPRVFPNTAPDPGPEAAPAGGERGPDDPVWNTRAMHAAEIPAVNGIGTARGMARLFAACIGEVDGIRLLSRSTMEAARTPQCDDVPTAPELLALGAAAPRFGLGFQLAGPATMPALGAGCFGHTGAGGRFVLACPERNIAVAFTCDTMLWDGLSGLDARWGPVLAALDDASENV